MITVNINIVAIIGVSSGFELYLISGFEMNYLLTV